MNKQIEKKLDEIILMVKRSWEGTEESPFDKVEGKAEAIYDRIAPLREFPEEAVEQILRMDGTSIKDRVLALADLKRLWEGGCPTCEGSGEVPCNPPVSMLEPLPRFEKPCPDCDGTGERRKVTDAK